MDNPRLLLTETMLGDGVGELCRRDADLARIVAQFGRPPLWVRESGFPTLIAIILEQQVSLASARAVFGRLLHAASPLTPECFLALDNAALQACGFSRQKIASSRSLAETVRDDRLALKTLECLDDSDVHAALTRLPGIGPWSAEVYLMMALRRPDIWPKGDRALALAAQRVKNLASCPTPEQLERIGDAWRPWRSVAAHLLWHDYLSRRARKEAPPPQ